MPDLGNLRVGVVVDTSGLTRGMAAASAQMRSAQGEIAASSNATAGAVEGHTSRIGAAYSAAATYVSNAVSGIGSALQGIASAVGNVAGNVGSAVTGAASWVASAAGQIAGHFGGIASAAGSLVSSIGSAASAITSHFSGVVGWASSLAGAVGSAFGGIANAAVGVEGWVTGAFGRIANAGLSLGSGVASVVGGIGGWFSRLGDAALNMAGAVTSHFSGLVTVAGNVASDIGAGFTSLGSHLGAIGSGIGNVFGSLGDIFGGLVSRFIPGFGGLGSSASEAAGGMAEAGGAAGAAGEAAGAAAGPIGAATMGVEALERSGKAAALGLGAVGGALLGFGITAVKAFSDTQQLRLAFTTMFHGNAQAADAFITSLQNMNTSMDYQVLTREAQSLLAVGMNAKDVVPTLYAIGDAAVATGRGNEGIDQISTALTQMISKGKVQAEEMMQLNEAGIPAWQFLANVLHTDVATAMDMVTKRQVDAAKAVPGLVDQMNKYYGGLSKARQQTLEGELGHLKYATTQTLSIVGGQIAKTFDISGVLQKMGDAMSKFQQVLQGKLTFGDMLSQLSGGAINAQQVNTSLANLGKTLQTIGDALKPVMALLGQVFGWFAKIAAEHLDWVMVAIAGVIAGLMTVALLGLAIAFAVVLIPMIPFILAGMAIAALAYLIISNWGGISGFFIGLWAAVSGAFMAAWGAVSAAVAGIIGFIVGVAGAIGGFFGAIFSAIGTFVSGAIGAIGAFFSAVGGIVSGIVGFIGGIFGAIGGFFGAVFGAIGGFLGAIWGVITGIFGAIWGFISYWGVTVLALILGPFVLAGIAIFNLLMGMWGFFVSILSAIWGWVSTVFGGIFSAIWSWLTAAWGVVVSILSAVWGFFVSIWNAVWGFVSGVLAGIFSTIWGWLTAAWSTIVAILTAVWGFFVSIFTSVWNWVSAVFGGIFNTIWSWMTAVWSTIVTVLTTVWNFFVFIWTTVWNFISGVWTGIWGTISFWVTTIFNMIYNWLVQNWSTINFWLTFIWTTAGNIWQGIWGTIQYWAGQVRDTVGSIFNSLGTIVHNALSALSTTVGNDVNWIIHRVNDFLDKVWATFHGFGIDLPIHQIPHLENFAYAQGGIVDQPTFLAGEQGIPESVIPWNPAYRDRAQALWKLTGEKLGFFSSMFGRFGIGGPGGAQGDWFPGSAPLLQGPGGGFSHQTLNAWDWGVPMGTPITMGLPGTVIPGPGGGYGTSLGVNLDAGGSVILGHLRDIVAMGKQAVGTVIAHSDNTGFSTGPHLHLEFRNSSLQPGPGGGGGGGVDIGSIINGIVNDILSAAGNGPQWLTGTLPQIVKTWAAPKLIEWIVKNFGDKLKSVAGFAGQVIQGIKGAFSGNVDDWIRQGEALAGVGDDWHGALKARIGVESGGDPNIDQSGLTGYAQAHGIMQMINSTFAAYALPGHTNIYNPVDNIAAAIRYIQKRYGGYAGMPPLTQGYAMGGIFQAMRSIPSVLADNGAMIPPRSLTGIVNASSRSEYVLTEEQMRRAGGLTVNVTVNGTDLHPNDVARAIVQAVDAA